MIDMLPVDGANMKLVIEPNTGAHPNEYDLAVARLLSMLAARCGPLRVEVVNHDNDALQTWIVEAECEIDGVYIAEWLDMNNIKHVVVEVYSQE